MRVPRLAFVPHTNRGQALPAFVTAEHAGFAGNPGHVIDASRAPRPDVHREACVPTGQCAGSKPQPPSACPAVDVECGPIGDGALSAARAGLLAPAMGEKLPLPTMQCGNAAGGKGGSNGNSGGGRNARVTMRRGGCQSPRPLVCLEEFFDSVDASSEQRRGGACNLREGARPGTSHAGSFGVALSPQNTPGNNAPPYACDGAGRTDEGAVADDAPVLFPGDLEMNGQ